MATPSLQPGPTFTTGPITAGPPTPNTTPAVTATPPSSGAAFDRAFVIVLENHSLSEALSGHQMPYLESLMPAGALATNYTAIGHPSQPNYIALFSGDPQGVEEDDLHDLDAPNVADQLEQRGRTWSVTAENVPSGCFTGQFEYDGRDGPGTYARKHEPAISFTSISGNPERCARIHDMTAFDPSEADFQLIVPNQCNDGHDCPLSTADGFLQQFVPGILESESFKANGVLFLTFDEPAEGDAPVLLLALGPNVRPGLTFTEPANHYSLLRTIEAAWGLGCLAQACDASPMEGLFNVWP